MDVAVAGATPGERATLAVLGGVAAEVAGSAVQSWQVPLRSWASAAPKPPAEIIDAVRLELGRGNDPLAALYNASISASNRRRLGTVFTPPVLVEHMLSLAARQFELAPSVVVDPGAGVGAFTIAAVQRWPTAEVVAVDVNVVTLGLLATRLAFEADAEPALASPLRGVRLVLADYLDHLAGVYGAEAAGPVLALGNPPYTRVQELSHRERGKAAELAGDLIDSGHANLAVLFQAATLRYMRPDDVSCMVLPGSFSYTRASRALRRALWQSKRPVLVHRTPATVKAFTGRSVQAAVLLVGPERVRRPRLKLARIDLGEDGVKVRDTWTVSRDLEPPDNWFYSSSEPADGAFATTLGEIATIHRGTATGANDVFFLTSKEASVLPPEVLVPGIVSLRGFACEELSVDIHRHHGHETTKRWLLAVPSGYALRGELRDYLSRHEEAVRARHLPSQRRSWYAITELRRPQLLISPLSKTTFKVVLNSARAVPSNSLFGISLKNGGDPELLADWLRSSEGQEEMRRLSRRYPGGSHKLEPGRLRNVRLPTRLADPWKLRLPE